MGEYEMNYNKIKKSLEWLKEVMLLLPDDTEELVFLKVERSIEKLEEILEQDVEL